MALGRKVKNFVKETWDNNCVQIVLQGNLAKFEQNEELQQFLKTTDGKILVEASPRDRIWGIGMGAANENANNPKKWRGKNLLGFVLTEVRDRLAG